MGPIFILGFPRSGTTALASALSQLPGLQDFSFEGHAFYLFTEGLRRVRTNQTNGNCVFRDEEKKQHFFANFARAMNAAFSVDGDPDALNWIDKTPDIDQVRAAPELSRLYPTAKFIYLYRRPDDAVRSNLATWPDLLEGKDMEVARRWANCSTAWRNAKSKLPKGSHMDLFQQDMLNKPGQVGNQVSNHLELDDAGRKLLCDFLQSNKRINRPHGKVASQYDARQLTDETREAVLQECADELKFWPKLTEPAA